MKEGIIDILLAEDNADDVEITKRALKESRVINRLFVVRDGEEALDYLFHKGQYQDKNKSPRPGLILLDINMPRMNGIDVLKRIKADVSLRFIPVVMLTVSRRDEDVVKSYDLGCNSFIAKPVDFDKFVELIKEINLYWGVLNVGIPPAYLTKDSEEGK